MIYIIGSGFSGLATAFVLIKKYKNITVISPSKSNVDNKSLTLMKYLLNLYGEIKFNSKRVSKKKLNLLRRIIIKIVNLLLHIKMEDYLIFGVEF